MPQLRQVPLTWLIHRLAHWTIAAVTCSCLLFAAHNNNEPSEWFCWFFWCWWLFSVVVLLVLVVVAAVVTVVAVVLLVGAMLPQLQGFGRLTCWLFGGAAVVAVVAVVLIGFEFSRQRSECWCCRCCCSSSSSLLLLFLHLKQC